MAGSPVTAASLDSWRRVIEVNLTGAFICCRAVVPHMAARGYGRVVNIASLRGREAPALSGAYAASKAGLMALTRTLAKEVATQGIRVNVVSPGVIATDLQNRVTSPEQLRNTATQITMRRVGVPEAQYA